MYSIDLICYVVTGKLLPTNEATLEKLQTPIIEHLVYDSRKIQHPAASLFFAITTSHNDGHRYIKEAHEKGVCAFVVSQKIALNDAFVIQVENTLEALQQLAAYHRSQFKLPVIGITGSNGKTIVKEWLNQLLEEDFLIVRSPKSFNSQIGVPLSVWQINSQHTLAIFEAGISQAGEMGKLQSIIQPTIGVLTNIGEAHNEGFVSEEEKLQEKLKLFAHAQVVIGQDHLLHNFKGQKLTWGYDEAGDVKIQSIIGKEQTTITASFQQTQFQITIPFTDEASVQNAITCLCVLLYLNSDAEKFTERFMRLHAVDMRLQLHHAINRCLLINDSYSADLTSLKIALDFLSEQSSGRKRTVILSDFFESGKEEAVLYHEIEHLLKSYGIEKIIVIGEKISHYLQEQPDTASISLQAFLTTEHFMQQFRSSQFSAEIILLKGARKFGFERIAALFEEKLHGTVLQINLSALAQNLKEYQKHLQPSAKIMAMVKAFSYGSGGAEIASVLQFHNTAYLGVAYADEGVDLVKAGISLPVMVMNPEEASFAAITEYDLQPVMYSHHLLEIFEAYVKEQGLTNYPVHLEIETGMNRLGFTVAEIDAIAKHISSSNLLSIQSVFSHLAASEEANQDTFTKTQAERFEKAVSTIQQYISYPFLKHVANSAAIIRHPQLQMDMVRLGIGLYGIESDGEEVLQLEPVATLHSTIAQIKEVKEEESVSYNRKGVVHRDSRIATVRIGYADGYSRQFGNGVGKMLVNDQLVPVIGTVCMDMTMIDVTDVEDVHEGGDVIIFGKDLPVQQVAKWINTIPYEVMTSVSQRVKRVYYYE